MTEGEMIDPQGVEELRAVVRRLVREVAELRAIIGRRKAFTDENGTEFTTQGIDVVTDVSCDGDSVVGIKKVIYVLVGAQ